jgi:hypothetical protein
LIPFTRRSFPAHLSELGQVCCRVDIVFSTKIASFSFFDRDICARHDAQKIKKKVKTLLRRTANDD